MGLHAAHTHTVIYSAGEANGDFLLRYWDIEAGNQVGAPLRIRHPVAEQQHIDWVAVADDGLAVAVACEYGEHARAGPHARNNAKWDVRIVGVRNGELV